MSIIAYLLCAGAGYLAGTYLPYTSATPYIPLLVSYHLFVVFLIVRAAVMSEQKVGMSMPLPAAVITHLAFLGAMIGIVMGRRYVPLFTLLQYAVPSLAPFEVKWLFERATRRDAVVEHERMPEGTLTDYAEFVEYMKQSNRKFQKPGRSIKDEYEAWSKTRSKNRRTVNPAGR